MTILIYSGMPPAAGLQQRQDRYQCHLQIYRRGQQTGSVSATIRPALFDQQSKIFLTLGTLPGPGNNKVKIPLGKDPIAIGRNNTNDVQIEGPAVSRQQIKITADAAGNHFWQNVSKNNSVWHNGREIPPNDPQRHLLRNGDRLNFAVRPSGNNVSPQTRKLSDSIFFIYNQDSSQSATNVDPFPLAPLIAIKEGLAQNAEQETPVKRLQRSEQLEIVPPQQALISVPATLAYFVQRENGHVVITAPTQKGKIAGVDTQREALFRDGQELFPVGNGQAVMIGPASWGETINSQYRSASTMQAYSGWKNQLPNSRELITLERSRALRSLLHTYNLELRDEVRAAKKESELIKINDVAADIIEAVISLFDKATFSRGHHYLKGLAVNASRRQAARISACEEGVVALYPYVTQFFWHLPAVVVHEIGHSFQPGRNIPESAQQAFTNNLRDLPPTLDQFVVDYVYGRDLRLSYVAQGSELIADLHVMYVYNGQAIRDYIYSGKDNYSITAWRNVYEFLRHYAFGGREFIVAK